MLGGGVDAATLVAALGATKGSLYDMVANVLGNTYSRWAYDTVLLYRLYTSGEPGLAHEQALVSLRLKQFIDAEVC